MKLLTEITSNQWLWDDFRAFHHRWGSFVQFQTGEVVFVDNEPGPDKRHSYSAMNVTVTASGDDNFPAVYHPETGKPIPKTHLNRGGQQWFVIDHDHKIMVRLARLGTGRNNSRIRELTQPIPEHLRYAAAAYWPGPDSPPIGGETIIEPPLPLTKEQRQAVEDLKDAVTAWAELKGLTYSPWRVKVEGRDVQVSGPVRIANLLGKSAADLTISERVNLWVQGIAPSYATEILPHLRLTPKA